MNYEEETAKEVPQKAPKLLQNIMQIPPEAIGVAVLLGLAAASVIPFWVAILVTVLGGLVVVVNNNRHERENAKGRASSYVNCNGPVVIYNAFPDETIDVLKGRADTWLNKLTESGNPYAGIIPIVIHEYKPVLTVQGSLQMSWSMYQVSVAQRQHDENMRWYNGKCPAAIKAQFAGDVLPAPNQAENTES